MGKNTSIALGDHFTEFLAAQVATGRYGSASEVIRAGLRLLEEREQALAELRAMIAEGEASGDTIPFEPDKWLADWKAEIQAKESVNDRHTSPRRA